MQLRTTIVAEGGPNALMRVTKRILQQAAIAAGRMWFANILPKHFTVQGGLEYGYQKRTAQYMRRKAYAMHHQRPLVFTGAMEREIRSVERVDPTARGAAIKLYGPRYFYAFRKDYGQADKAREVTTVTVREEAAMAGLVERISTHKMQRSREREVVYRGGQSF